jgi:DNA-binding transcriptional ArsR family regulator
MTHRVTATRAVGARKSRRHNATHSPEAGALHRADELASIFKMLSNPNRLKIILFLAAQERSVGEMEAVLGIHQPTLSQQIGELRDAALIRGRRVAKSAIYALTADRGQRALHTIYTLSGSMSPPAQMLLERSHTSRRSQPAAVFAAVFASNGEARAARRHPSTGMYRSERP